MELGERNDTPAVMVHRDAVERAGVTFHEPCRVIERDGRKVAPLLHTALYRHAGGRA